MIESVLRRRLSPAVRQYASLVGLFVLVLLVVLAFKNDIERKWPQIIDLVATE